MLYIVVSTLRSFRVVRTAYVLLPVQCAALRSSRWSVCAAEPFDVYVSYSTTSEAVDHVSMRSATAKAIKGNGRDVVVRKIASELDDV